MAKKDYSNIMFGYMNAPSYGCFGRSDGGFSVEIYSDGTLIHKMYIFSRKEKTNTMLTLPLNAIEEILSVLDENRTDIVNFEEHIDNGSLDGSSNEFIFYGKCIITWNIEYCDEEELMERNPQYYRDYLQVIRQQNKMLFIFEKICEILEKNGIKLNLYQVNYSLNH